MTESERRPDPFDEEGSELSEYTEEEELTVQRQVPWLYLTETFAINLLIPFINGLMLGFGEIFAHELGAHWGWRQAKVYNPSETQARQRRVRWLWPFF